MKPRSFGDRLTFTRVASWSDRGSHRRRLARHGLAAKKVYVLGYAAAFPGTVQRIRQCVQQQSAGGLRGVFRDLPHSAEWWSEPLGPMCTVYLLVEPGHVPQLVALDASPESPVLLHMPAPGFPFHFVFGKIIVSEAPQGL
jgi:hypothetical protein